MTKNYVENQNLPEIPFCIDNGRIEMIKNGYALIEATSRLNGKECYHILQLSICGKGWENGRYDLPYNWDTFCKFMNIAEFKYSY